MNLKQTAKNTGRWLIMRLAGKQKNKGEKTIFFSSFSGKQYSDSPKVISERIHELAPNVRIIWSAMETVDQYLPDYVKPVRPATAEALRAQAAADVWVINNILQHGVYKGKHTFYIQTWHGDRSFKLVGADAKRAMGKKYTKYQSFVEEKICDLFLTASVNGAATARSAFNYRGELLDVGIPRNDRLIHLEEQKDFAASVRRNLHISDDTKILLYAPTFRDRKKDKQKSDADLSEALDALEANGEKWICLTRAHTRSAGLENNWNDARFMDVTDYPDIADLLIVTDLLITDYSSSAQDYVLTNRPVILVQFDIDEYAEDVRALRDDPMDTGFLIAHNQDEFMNLIRNLSSYDHAAIARKVLDYYGTHESGHATEAVCERIMEWLNRGK